ncbi:hypothetical protein BKA62DRAFT_766146 [Auriculariales sp. MPI-PUGE-AT-0066]|nr:hypothetical protein BKA62DRAFT_766146 [Auriculariales sp. MPI-PUGE-AT-0066]
MQLSTFLFALALPLTLFAAPSPTELVPRSEPTFPAYPPSCYLCQPDYANINSCAEAAPVFENFSSIIRNPLGSIAMIECACTDTFQSAYPQCADCFIQTNQTQYLNSTQEGVPKIIEGIRNICSIASTILGHPVGNNGEAEGSTPISVPSPTGGATTSARADHAPTVLLGLVGVLGVFAGVSTIWL